MGRRRRPQRRRLSPLQFSRKITPDGTVTTLAGNGTVGDADGLLAEAQFRAPEGIGVDSQGNIHVADTGNQSIREIVQQP